MSVPRTTNKARPTEVTRDDVRYATFVQKRFNKRFPGTPEAFRLVDSTEQVVETLEEIVKTNRRLAVRSGGHCLDGLVSDPAVQVVIDTSLMSSVCYDEKIGAFAIEAGATLGEVYRKLFVGWGALLPAGQSPDIGVGGHVLGGAFGFVHREHGLAVDSLYAVEVVVVDAAGKARSVLATREPSDPNRELWWAHTGCGGGNFGIVTRYLFRSPGASGNDPTELLPKAPQEVTTFKVEWDWKQLDEASFVALVRNYGQWCEENSEPDSPFARLFSVLVIGRPPHGNIALRGVVTAGAAAAPLVEAHLAAVQQGCPAVRSRDGGRSSWLGFALNPFPDLFAIGPAGVAASPASLKLKDALLCKRHTDRQLAVAYDYLTRKELGVPGGSFGLAALGGRVNAVSPDATAFAQRQAIMTTSYGVGWGAPEDEAPSLRWVRDFYRDVFAETGGVPAPGERTDGALINHPDADLADPALNTSGVPWSTLYYKENYPRLQRVKAEWDPRDVFHHALSIRATQ